MELQVAPRCHSTAKLNYFLHRTQASVTDNKITHTVSAHSRPHTSPRSCSLFCKIEGCWIWELIKRKPTTGNSCHENIWWLALPHSWENNAYLKYNAYLENKQINIQIEQTRKWSLKLKKGRCKDSKQVKVFIFDILLGSCSWIRSTKKWFEV